MNKKQSFLAISFDGRLQRMECFKKMLFSAVPLIGLTVGWAVWQFILALLALDVSSNILVPLINIVLILGVIVSLVWSPIYLLSVYARRWHDLNESGWLSLLTLIPGIGFLVVVYLLFASSKA